MSCADSLPAEKVRRRRYFRFSLRALAIVVTAFTIGIGLKANRANRQQNAVEQLGAVGAQFHYDYQILPDFYETPPGFLSFDRKKPVPGPLWLRGILGEHYFITVVEARVRARRQISDPPVGILRFLGGLPDLEQLTLANIRLRDSDIAYLPALKKLRYFQIDPTIYAGNNSIRDYSFLQGFPRLRTLSVSFSLFGDDDVKYLHRAVDMQWLHLTDTPIGDAGLAQLQHMSKLESLTLARTKITDAGLASLRSFPKLSSLNLNKTAVTDAGLAHLSSLRAITSLSLVDTAVSDVGLEHLKSLPNLQRLDLVDAKVSEEGAANLHAALPNCRIQIEWARWIPSQ